MQYGNIYNTIVEKINKAIEEDKAHPLLLIGGYRTGEVMHLDNSALFDEFMEGDPEFDAMEVTPDADYGEQFEQFTEALRKGYTFGDYQEFATLKKRLLDLQVEVGRMESDGESPAKLWDSDEWGDVCRVRINGSTVDLSGKVGRWNDAFAELDDYLEELDHLAWEHE